MGTWSTDVLGNDAALDTLGALTDRELSFTDLADELRGGYIESDAGAAVLALVEVALAARGLRDLPHTEAVEAARDLLDDERAAWLLDQTDQVLGAGSEVYELWQEASEQSLSEWLGKVEASIEDLRQALSAAPAGAVGGSGD
ncbi:DUF4259 domain-containing protein [Promicromonospora kroppenstedtii]|uniref:DUF4259 domain-containing protein n=1 Tax=Promicromonospora kroppenstedtii TaxID=440482 RepID=UPI0004BABD58|nr:DUF4259 domain-containing protein [Promicromonospora kroppenstedtii]